MWIKIEIYPNNNNMYDIACLFKPNDRRKGFIKHIKIYILINEKYIY